MLTLWWIVLGISVAVYAALAGVMFSRAFFYAVQARPFDRGLMSFKEKNGKSIVYEPRPDYRKYMSQYILSDRGGKKSILCKLSEDVGSIDYDIVLFNAADKVLKIVNINEIIEKTGFTREIDLPENASYASVVINRVNKAPISDKRSKSVLNRRTALFSCINGVLTVAEVFFIKLCLANIFADVFAADFLTSVKGIFITLAVAVAASLINIPAAAVYITLKNKRGSVREL